MTDERDKRNILVALTLAMFGGSLTMSSISIALPSIATEMSLNAVQIGWVSLAMSLASAVFILPFGRLADIFGRKKIFTAGLIASLAGMIATACSVSWAMLVSCQIGTGIGGAMFAATSIALLSSVYAPAERGRALGLMVAAIYFGQSVGPTIGGVLTYNFGWRFIVVPAVILQSLSLLFISMKIKGEWVGAKGEKFDIAGSALFAIMLFCILYGFSAINTQTGMWITLAGIGLLVIFVILEMRTSSPMINLRLLARSRLFAFSGMTHLFFYIVSMPVPFIMSLYLQYIRGLNAQVAGIILLIQPAMMAIFSPVAGRISDRIEPRKTVSVGISIVFIGILFLFFAIVNAWLSTIIIGLVMIGFGYAFFASPNTNAIVGSVSKQDYGVASAFESTMRSIGMNLGMGIVIMLFSINMGSAEITPEYYEPFLESVKAAFIIFAVFLLLSICVSALRGRRIKLD